MDALEQAARLALGVGAESHDIAIAQMALRGASIYIAVLVLVRLAKKRFMSQASAFDVILGVMIGSIASRAVTGGAPILPALAAVAAMIALHTLFSRLAVNWHGFGIAIKGRPSTLVRDGKIDEKQMRAAHLSEHDLWEDLRQEGVDDLARVAHGRLERSGKVSVIRAKPSPKIVSIDVTDGVQTVRVELA